MSGNRLLQFRNWFTRNRRRIVISRFDRHVRRIDFPAGYFRESKPAGFLCRSLQEQSIPPAKPNLRWKRTETTISLETISTTVSNSAAEQRGKRLCAAMGVRSSSARPRANPGWRLVEGCRIAWEATPSGANDAQPVVCLHSAGAGSREFRPLLDRRPSGSRLILLDWPGHGRSDSLATSSRDPAPLFSVDFCASLLHNLLRQLGIEKPILLGSGFGAAVAIRYAAESPGSVQGLVLCQPAGLVPPSSAGPYSQRGKRGVRRLLRRMQRFVPGKPGRGSQFAAHRQALRMEALRPTMLAIRAAAAESLEQSAPSLRTALESLSCPTLFALSHDNREYPLRRYMALLDPSLAWATQHQFTVFAGAFHPLWDEPDRFSQALTSFVQAQLPVGRHTHAWLLHAVDSPTDGNNLWKCVHPDCSAERILPAGINAN